MDFALAGKVVLVTGGSDGLGAALVRTLASEGVHVAFCGRNEDRITAVADEVTAAGGDVLGVRADVTDGSDLRDFVSAAHDRWGRVDGLVNNAGTSSAVPFDQQTESDWDDDLDLKLRAAIRAIRLVLPFMRSAGGSIVNVLATAARAPAAGSTPTSVSRAAGLALTKALSKEFGPELIRVNAILVGLVQSGQWDRRAAARGIPVDELYAELAAVRQVPLGRVGLAAEFADLAAFLLSERSAYITGAAINFDGGSSPVP
ncbi:MAG TPA: SDR family oxidoreductase [Streptosporangiaceae bacterium]|nr:SDR family oxidoreductase [Streptosporangiaceae bacterium]